MKLASKSFGQSYECKQEWPESIYVQCGEKGVVFSKNGNYQTAFFEAFPISPETFIRGEGSNIEEAEIKAFEKYTKIMNCSQHEMVRRKESEAGTCKHCGLTLSNCLPPLKNCDLCGKEHVKLCFKETGKEKLVLCLDHYLERMEKYKDFFVPNNLNIFFKEKEDIFDFEKMSLMDWDMYQHLILNKKYGMLTEKNEYESITRIDNETTKFFSFMLMEERRVLKERFNNQQLIEVSFYSPSLTPFLSIYPELFEKMWKKFKKVTNEDFTDEMEIFLKTIAPLMKNYLETHN